MGIVLGRDGEKGYLNWPGYRLWAFSLDVAEEYGWKPAGTQATPWTGEGWDGSYETSDGQYVTADDAAGLGQALARAAEDEELYSVVCDVAERKWDQVPVEWSPKEAARIVELTLDEYRHALRELAEFCLRGGFRIA
jgi:hypothetical protein